MTQADLTPEMLERTLTITCTAQEYQTILTQTDPRMRAQLILSGLGMLHTVAMVRESKGKQETEESKPPCFMADETCKGDMFLCNSCDTWYCDKHCQEHDILDLL